jgi:hypothetical protein
MRRRVLRLAPGRQETGRLEIVRLDKAQQVVKHQNPHPPGLLLLAFTLGFT